MAMQKGVSKIRKWLFGIGFISLSVLAFVGLVRLEAPRAAAAVTRAVEAPLAGQKGTVAPAVKPEVALPAAVQPKPLLVEEKHVSADDEAYARLIATAMRQEFGPFDGGQGEPLALPSKRKHKRQKIQEKTPEVQLGQALSDPEPTPELAMPDLKGKRLSTAIKDAKKMGLKIVARDEYGTRISAYEAANYRVRKQVIEAGTEFEPGATLKVTAREIYESAGGY